MGKTETIITDGHHIYTDGHHIYTDGKELRVNFFDNPFGARLKRMWEQLNEPPKKRHYKKGDKRQ